MKIEPERMLANLAADLAEVRTRLQLIEGQRLVDQMGQMRTTLGDLAELVAALQPVEEEPQDPGPVVAPNWADLDQSQAAEAWEVLVTWCRDVYRPMYALQQWRPCWYRHPLLRIQLSWLCANWHWSYMAKCPPTRPAEWHTRWWPSVQSFMDEELRRCGPSTDQLLGPVHSPPKGIEGNGFEDGLMSAYIERDIARRPPPPNPDDD